jgi:hypothetical protein
MISAPKHATRLANFAALRALSPKGSALCTPTGQLRVDWLELAGPEAPTAQILIDADALTAQGRFIGVDNDRDVITRAKRAYKSNPNVVLQHVEGNFLHMLDTDAADRVGVVIFDSWNGAKGREVEEHLDVLFDFAQRQRQALGAFFLGLNVTLRGVERTAGVAAYKRGISKRYGRKIPEQAWTTYQSAKGRQPMLLTRLFWL